MGTLKWEIGAVLDTVHCTFIGFSTPWKLYMYIHVGAMNIKLCMSISHKSSLKLQSTKSLLCADKYCRLEILNCGVGVASFQAFQVLYLSACGTRLVAYKNGEGLGVSIT